MEHFILTDFFRCLRGHCAVLQGNLRISCTRLAAYAACWGLRAHFVVEVFVSLAIAGFPLCTGGLFAHFCLTQMTACRIIPLSFADTRDWLLLGRGLYSRMGLCVGLLCTSTRGLTAVFSRMIGTTSGALWGL